MQNSIDNFRSTYLSLPYNLPPKSSIATQSFESDANPDLIDDPFDRTFHKTDDINEGREGFILSKIAEYDISLDDIHKGLFKLSNGRNDLEILNSFKTPEKDKHGRTVAHYCAALGRLDLLKQMENFDIKDNKENTPLSYAIITGQETTVAYLISQEGNSSLDTQDVQGFNLLMLACQCHQVNIAKLLIEKSAEKNCLKSLIKTPNKAGLYPIHKACELGNFELVKLLIENGKVDYAQEANDGRLPLDFAKTAKAQDVINYLKEKKNYNFALMNVLMV